MKKLLFIFGGFVVLLLIAGLVLVGLAPQDFGVEREVVINKPKAEVFAYLKMLKNQNDWGAWAKKDPNIKVEYTGNDGEVGFVSSWQSNDSEVGTGEQEIKKIDDGKRIDYELRFKKPFESTSNAWITTEEAGENKTKVKWGFKGKMPAPFNALMLFVDMEGPISKDFDEGLASLKKILESQ
jgi:uncharacterized protein YndB with AHSA1/START domain